MEQEKPKIKWWFKPYIVIIALFCLGPFALSLLWGSPAFKKTHKVLITISQIVLTIGLARATMAVYERLLNQMLEAQGILG